MDEVNEDKTYEIILKKTPYEKGHASYKEASKFPGVSIVGTPPAHFQRHENTISFKFPRSIYTRISNVRNIVSL
jgi:hypothetical protein